MTTKTKILSAAVLLSLILLIIWIFVKSPVLTNGFASYYTSSKLLATGQDIPASYDTVYYNAKLLQYGFGEVKDLPNLPTGSFIMMPFIRLQPAEAKTAWNIFSLLCLLASVALILRSAGIDLKSPHGFALILITFLFYPLYYNFSLGQAYVFLLLLFSLSLYGLKTNRSLMVSVPLSLVLILKGYGFFPLAALLFSGKRKEFFQTIGITSALLIITLPLFGQESWQMYYHKFYSVVAYGAHSSNTAYQSLNSFFGHLFSFKPVTNPDALLGIPQVYIYYILQVTGFSALICVSYKYKPVNTVFLFTAAIALNVMFSPSAEDYHSVLYLPLIYMTVKHFYDGYSPGKFMRIILVASVLLLALPLPFRKLQTSGFPEYLLAYPRLYGAVILTILLLYLKNHSLRAAGSEDMNTKL